MPRKKDDAGASAPLREATLPGRVTLLRTAHAAWTRPSADSDSVLELSIPELESCKLEALRRMHASYPRSCTWQEARLIGNWLREGGREIPYDLLGEAGEYVMGHWATPSFVALWWLAAHAPASGLFTPGAVLDISEALLSLVELEDSHPVLPRLAAFFGEAARERQMVVLGP